MHKLSYILFAGILGHAEPAPVAQPAAASMTAPSGEPQLTPKGTGGGRGWGPSHFEAAPAAAPADAAACSLMAAAGTPCASAACKFCYTRQGCLTGIRTVTQESYILLCAT